ncbi:MAG TPA: hypothetical protein VGL22_14690 [Terracidiphilus sp.]|jgi:hypothetical protein
MPFEPEQLELLKRRAEEDYRLDIAAIERLQRRFRALTASPATTSHASTSSVSATETTDTQSTHASASREDETTGFRRPMFSSQVR